MSAVTSSPLSGIRALVVGLGSIGATHARVLEALGATVEAVSRRESAEGTTTHASIEAALAGDGFDYCVVASATSDHAADVKALAEAGFAGTLLVEKPVAVRSGEFPAEASFERVGVGYNLRFHPAVGWLREQLEGQSALVVDLAAQSFLPDWRPGRDHRETASGSRARGGGVLRDLSHEIDLMLWLFGEPRQAMALGGNLGDLGIDAETAACAVLGLERAPLATLRLSYLDRLPERRVRVTTASDTLEADLLSGECRTSSAGERYEIDWTKTYADLHLAMLGPDRDAVCTLGEGLRVVSCIEELESAWAG
ncbi:MAG TPA: Gfo/Idh/MocA family oxidoreductase [Solirubrobacterales bacterium]|jgi:predicted dehydrogenase